MKSWSRFAFILLLVMFCQQVLAYTDHRSFRADSLEQVLLHNPPADKAALVRLYEGLATGYLEVNGKKSYAYAEQGLAVAAQIEAYYSMAGFYRQQGMIHWGANEFSQAADKFELTLQMIEKMRQSGKYDEETIDDMSAQTYGAMGNLYNTMGNGAKSLQYYHQALRLFVHYGWKQSQSICYGNMAELFRCMGNLDKAEEYLGKSLAVVNELNDSLMMYYCYRKLSGCALARGDVETARQHIGRVSQYLFAHPDAEGTSRADCLEAMTDIALHEGDYGRAEHLLTQNQALCDTLDYITSGVLLQWSFIHAHKGDWPQAEAKALEALQWAEEEPYMEAAACKQLSSVYSHLGKPDLANLYLAKSDSIQSAWSNYAYQASISEQEVLYQTEEKNTLIDALSDQNRLLLWVTIASILLLVLLFVLFILLRKSIRRKHALEASRIAMEAEIKERSILAQDLHDGLGGMLSVLKLKLQDNDQDAAKKLLDESMVEMRRIAHHIMPESLQKNGLVTSLHDFAISVPGAQFHYFGPDQRLSMEAETTLYRCAYELVNNAHKHSGAEHIDIQLMVDAEQAILTVSDDGRGFDEAEAWQKGGTGLKNIQNRINKYEGKLEIVKTLQAGSEINVILPLSRLQK